MKNKKLKEATNEDLFELREFCNELHVIVGVKYSVERQYMPDSLLDDINLFTKQVENELSKRDLI